jgi:hypothetical protein
LTAVSHIIIWGTIQRPEAAPKKRVIQTIEPD